jgi:hypothetical protein
VARRTAHDEKLPPEIFGRWTLTNSTAIFNEPFSIAFDGSRGPETVSGRLAWRGIMCGAKDEPIQAQWDGPEFRFEAVLKPDTNTQRSYGTCAPDPSAGR